MISLPNNCYCSELKVMPKNWKTAKASLKDKWMVYSFYDPCFKADPKYTKGKLVRLKGMNSFMELSSRQQQVCDGKAFGHDRSFLSQINSPGSTLASFKIPHYGFLCLLILRLPHFY